MTATEQPDPPHGGWQLPPAPAPPGGGNGQASATLTGDLPRQLSPDLPSPAPASGRQPAVWWLALLVALCGAVATAHGLFDVVHRCGVTMSLAWLWVPITDGLALVAYACTPRLRGAARWYAWAVVVVCAGLSGLAQAVNLAGLGDPDWRLKFGVGYWPAVAVAVAAHLLWLVAEESGSSAGSSAGSSGAERQIERASERQLSADSALSAERIERPPSAEPGAESSAERAPDRAPLALLSSAGAERSAGARASAEGRAAQRSASGKVRCGCGQSNCAGLVGASTARAHRRQVRESSGD